MIAHSTHASVVSEWLETTVADRATRDVLPLFGRALLAIWTRAHVTLGEVTLRAVLDRVFHGARARFPVLRALGLDSDVDSFRTLGERDASHVDRADLVAAIQLTLTELLVILGTLTADVLTEPLHEALRAVGAPAPLASKSLAPKVGTPS